MTLRARLLLTVAGLLAVALVVTGLLIAGLTRASLVAQVDDQLRRTATGGRLERILELDPGDQLLGRSSAWLILGPGGAILASAPSGPATAPDPLPEVPADATGPASLPPGTIVDASSRDGSVDYRMLVARGPRDTTLLLASPLSDVQAATAALVRNLFLVGLLVLAVGLAIGWVLIRRDLRPLDTIAATASRIAGGDLSQRVDAADPRTEVGQVGVAFNTMLDAIETAFGEQQAALEAKERSEAKLRRFVADASHELRTPLTTVRGYAELYGAGGLEDRDELDRAMRRIDTESRRMAALTEDLLLLARLDQGRPLALEPVDLSRLASEAVTDLAATDPDRPTTASIEAGVSVLGDEDRLRQVIGNLLVNVRVHTPPRTPVEVELRSTDGVSTLAIVDHGPGIEDVHAGRIFDRFFRADPARSRDKGGSGLGLAIASSVLAVQGGTITHRPTPGGGATFEVTLPVAAPAPAHRSEPDPASAEAGSAQRRDAGDEPTHDVEPA